MTDACPLCESSDLLVLVERHGVPVHQNLPLPSEELARTTVRGDLRIACCRACGFVTNTAFRQELVQYGAGYENDQTHSGLFDAHVDSLIDQLVASGVRGCDVVEVACGQGTFLNRLCERGKNRGIGFDPAYVGPDEGPRTRFVRRYFGAGSGVRAEVVICRHAIEHVHRPLELLTAVREGLADVPRARVAFETPDLTWILDRVVIQDFFYEHCSYFTPETLTYAFALAGFTTESVTRLFGDQYLWLEATHRAGVSATPSRPNPAALLHKIGEYRAREAERMHRLSDRLVRLRELGPVAVWGGGAKGVTFLNLLDPDRRLVDAVIDINPKKRGLFVPGTAHPIIAIEDIAARGVRNAIVMNPNYLGEIRAQVRSAGVSLGLETEADT